jgi:hypothetical protein
VLRKMFHQDLTKFVQWQTGHDIGIIFDSAHVDTSKVSAVNLSPANTVRGEATSPNIRHDTSFAHFLDGWGSIMGSTRLSIQRIAHIDQGNIDVLPGESQAEEKTRRSSTNDDDLASQ